MSQITTLEPSLEALDGLGELDALCLVVAQDDRPLQGALGYVDWRLCGALSRMLQDHFFDGKLGEQVLFPPQGMLPVRRIFAIGAGPSYTLHAQGLGDALELAGKMLAKAGVASAALALPLSPKATEADRVAAIKRFEWPFGPGRVVVFTERAAKGG